MAAIQGEQLRAVLADERLEQFVGAGPRRSQLEPLPAGDRSRCVDGVPADRQLIELRVADLHLNAVEVEDDGTVGIPVPVLDEAHEREARQAPATKRGQARRVFLPDGLESDEKGRLEAGDAHHDRRLSGCQPAIGRKDGSDGGVGRWRPGNSLSVAGVR